MTEYNPAIEPHLMLAWRIWSASRAPVPIEETSMRAELEPALRNGMEFEDEKGLHFASELSMVQAASQYIVHAEGPLLTSTAKACFERLGEIFETGKCEKRQRLWSCPCTTAQRWPARRVFLGAAGHRNGVGVFEVLPVLEGAVIHFKNAQSESIFQFFAGHSESVKNDLAGGLVYPKLQAWFAHHPVVAREVKN